MVNRKVPTKLHGDYGNQIQNLNEEREEQIERRSVEVFFSFDIVNSTAYKILNFTGAKAICVFEE